MEMKFLLQKRRYYLALFVCISFMEMMAADLIRNSLILQSQILSGMGGMKVIGVSIPPLGTVPKSAKKSTHLFLVLLST